MPRSRRRRSILMKRELGRLHFPLARKERCDAFSRSLRKFFHSIPGRVRACRLDASRVSRRVRHPFLLSLFSSPKGFDRERSRIIIVELHYRIPHLRPDKSDDGTGKFAINETTMTIGRGRERERKRGGGKKIRASFV